VSEHRQRIRQLVKRPLLALIALTVLLCLTIGLSFAPLGEMGIGNLIVSLIIAGAKIAIIVVIFMELPKGSAVQQLAAGVGVFWLSFLFLLGFADYLSR
jgi:cytochrome c oxidase subunit IV